MAQTAVVNRRRRRKDGRFMKGGKKRRRNPSSSNANPPRRRRRSYGSASGRRRRRRNPGTAIKAAYGPRTYRRTNPDFVTESINAITKVTPGATAGVLAARFALKQAGEFEDTDDKGNKVPGIKHAIAIYLAAKFGGELIAGASSREAGLYAAISALGFGGDLFLRTRFMRDSEMYRDNFSLAGIGQCEDDETGSDEEFIEYEDETDEPYELEGMGRTLVDSAGNRYVHTDRGWQLAGMGAEPQLMVGADGTVYQVMSGISEDPSHTSAARLAGFQTQSALGRMHGFQTQSALGRYASGGSSFGYSRR